MVGIQGCVLAVSSCLSSKVVCRWLMNVNATYLGGVSSLLFRMGPPHFSGATNKIPIYSNCRLGVFRPRCCVDEILLVIIKFVNVVEWFAFQDQ